MGYIIGLFIILGIIFTSFSGGFLSSNLTDGIKINTGSISNLGSQIRKKIIPKTEREILIENIGSSYNFLDGFFSKTIPQILESGDISEAEKEQVKKAVEVFIQSKDDVSKLQEMEEKSPGIIKQTIENVLDKNKEPGIETKIIREVYINNGTVSDEQNSNSQGPLIIAPQCQLQCSD